MGELNFSAPGQAVWFCQRCQGQETRFLRISSIGLKQTLSKTNNITIGKGCSGVYQDQTACSRTNRTNLRVGVGPSAQRSLFRGKSTSREATHPFFKARAAVKNGSRLMNAARFNWSPHFFWCCGLGGSATNAAEATERRWTRIRKRTGLQL